jgi:hypothetical protein
MTRDQAAAIIKGFAPHAERCHLVDFPEAGLGFEQAA